MFSALANRPISVTVPVTPASRTRAPATLPLTVSPDWVVPFPVAVVTEIVVPLAGLSTVAVAELALTAGHDPLATRATVAAPVVTYRSGAVRLAGRYADGVGRK